MESVLTGGGSKIPKIWLTSFVNFPFFGGTRWLETLSPSSLLRAPARPGALELEVGTVGRQAGTAAKFVG